MKKSLSSRIRFLLSLLFLSSLHASLALAEKLPIKVYTVSDGLAHNKVNRIVLDSRGFLWFCTGDGLSRFDGYAFANFGVDQGLAHPNVTDFLETREGTFTFLPAITLATGLSPGTYNVGPCSCFLTGEAAPNAYFVLGSTGFLQVKH